MQKKVANNILTSDIQTLDNRYSGKYISNVLYYSHHVRNLDSNGLLNLMKDTFSVIALVSLMFYQNWKLSLIAIVRITLTSYAAKSLCKRMSKIINLQMKEASLVNSYLLEIFKNHKLIKIFQREKDEKVKANRYLNNLKEFNKKINIVFN